jgi:hypothetical protein
MATKFKNMITKFFSNLLNKWIEDFFILFGIGIIVGTTYTLSIFIANYLLGFIFLAIGFLLAKK